MSTQNLLPIDQSTFGQKKEGRGGGEEQIVIGLVSVSLIDRRGRRREQKAESIEIVNSSILLKIKRYLIIQFKNFLFHP